MNLKKTKAIKQRKYCVLSEKMIVGLDRNVKSTAIKISMKTMKMLVLEIILAGKPDLFYKGKACSQVLLLCIQDDTDIYKIKFGTIQSEESLREHGCMTFLVASVIYIMLKDKDLKQKDIEISLDMSSNAKNILREKKIDVYHRIFRVPKINNNTRELSRRTVFEARNRDKDIDYFRDVLILKEQEIVEAVSNRKVD